MHRGRRRYRCAGTAVDRYVRSLLACHRRLQIASLGQPAVVRVSIINRSMIPPIIGFIKHHGIVGRCGRGGAGWRSKTGRHDGSSSCPFLPPLRSFPRIGTRWPSRFCSNPHNHVVCRSSIFQAPCFKLQRGDIPSPLPVSLSSLSPRPILRDNALADSSAFCHSDGSTTADTNRAFKQKTLRSHSRWPSV